MVTEVNENMELSWQKLAGTPWVHPLLRLGAKHVSSAGQQLTLVPEGRGEGSSAKHSPTEPQITPVSGLKLTL